MEFALGIADYAVIVLMMSISAGIGIYFRCTGGKQSTTLEFLMADKNMSILPVTFSMLATTYSAVAVLGVSAEVYLYGTQLLMKEFARMFGLLVVAYWILPVYFEIGENSIYEYLARRFGKTLKIMISVLFSLQMLLYMPVVIYAPCLALSTLTGLSVWTAVISMAVVCTFYSTLGGLKAVLWTDLFQAILVFLSLYCLIVKGSLEFGGFSKIFEIAQNGQRLKLFKTDFDFTTRYTLWNTLAQGFVFGVLWSGTTFLSVQRLLSSGTLKKAQKCLLWNIPLSILFQGGVVFLGIIMYSFYCGCDPIKNKEIKSADQLILLYILKLFGNTPGLPGLCVAGIFSAALSSMSSVINSLAAITLEDYIIPFMKCKSLKESSKSILVKGLAVLYGCICLLLTVVMAYTKGLLQTSIVLAGMVGGPTLGVFSLGMFTTSANELGSIIGLIAGFSLNAWIGFGSLFSKWKYPALPLSTTGCLSNTSTLMDEITQGNFTLDAYFTNNTSFANTVDIESERYIFPLYKISYTWYACISFLTSFILGYIASYIIGFWKPNKEVNPQLLSPAVRKWLIKAPISEKKEPYQLPLMESKEDNIKEPYQLPLMESKEDNIKEPYQLSLMESKEDNIKEPYQLSLMESKEDNI